MLQKKYIFTGKRFFFALLIGSYLLTLMGCTTPLSPGGTHLSSTGLRMGTVVTLDVWTRDKELMADLDSRLAAIEAQMSRVRSDSQLNRLNLTQKPTALDPALEAIIRRGLVYGRESEGQFDITVGPLVSLWGIGTEAARVPEPEEIQEALKAVDYRAVTIQDHQLIRARTGMQIDLGGIAKGYAADELVAMLRERQVSRALLNLGGNIYALGESPEGRPWLVGLQNPFDTQGSYLGTVAVRDQTVVSSGNYERYLIANGKRYHHILNPATGYPVENGTAMVTLIGTSSMDADALSTTLFAMGHSKGLPWLAENHPEFAAIFVTENKEVYVSPGAKAFFQLTHPDFTLMN